MHKKQSRSKKTKEIKRNKKTKRGRKKRLRKQEGEKEKEEKQRQGKTVKKSEEEFVFIEGKYRCEIKKNITRTEYKSKVENQ